MLTFTNYITRFSDISAGYHASIRITDFCWQGTGTRPAARPFRDSSTMISMAFRIQQRYIIQQPSCCFYCFLVMSTYIKTVKPPGIYLKKNVKSSDKLPINWCRISFINSIKSTNVGKAFWGIQNKQPPTFRSCVHVAFWNTYFPDIYTSHIWTKRVSMQFDCIRFLNAIVLRVENLWTLTLTVNQNNHQKHSTEIPDPAFASAGCCRRRIRNSTVAFFSSSWSCENHSRLKRWEVWPDWCLFF